MEKSSSPVFPMIDAVQYDQFDFKHYDETPLSLPEATKAAAAMRKRNPRKFYRVVQAEQSGETFYVDSLQPETVYAQLLARLANAWSRLASR